MAILRKISPLLSLFGTIVRGPHPEPAIDHSPVIDDGKRIIAQFRDQSRKYGFERIGAVELPLTLKQAFRTDEVFCLVCGKGA
jgi:hypothetical protein